MIGAFHQPRLVLADSRHLMTLPLREYRAGLAEVAKYGVIRDADFFDWLERNATVCRDRELEAVRHMVAISCACKASVVTEDEREDGVRALLNLGHTFGHALESITGYGEFLHGEAVALGMVCAGRLAVRRGLWKANDEIRQRNLLESLGLPTRLPGSLRVDRQAAWEMCCRDKKARNGAARFVLPTSIGSAEVVSGIGFEEVDEAWKAIEA
jgi:3-dehydroquinate synthetase